MSDPDVKIERTCPDRRTSWLHISCGDIFRKLRRSFLVQEQTKHEPVKGQLGFMFHTMVETYPLT